MKEISHTAKMRNKIMCVCVCGVLSRYSFLRWWATVCRGRSIVRGNETVDRLAQNAAHSAETELNVYTQLYRVFKQSKTVANISAVLRLFCRVAVSWWWRHHWSPGQPILSRRLVPHHRRLDVLISPHTYDKFTTFVSSVGLNFSVYISIYDVSYAFVW